MKIKSVKSTQDLEALRNFWEGWQAHPNCDFDHFQLVCRIRPEVACPYVVVVEQDGKPRTILAARLERTHFSLSFGYFKPLRIPATIVVVIYQGLLGDADENIAESLVSHLRSCLRSGEADAVLFSHLLEKSPLLDGLLRHGPSAWREKNLEWATHRGMHVPAEPGFILNSMKSKHRSWIRGRERKLNKTFSDEVSWHWMDRFEDLPHLCARLEDVAGKTYQRGLGAGFLNNEEFRQRYALFADRGQLRMQVLEIQDRIRAFWIGIVYDGVYYATETGYDPDLRGFEVGTLGLVKTVDDLAREGVREIDFGFGEASYKKRHGNQCWRETTLRWFAPGVKGLTLQSLLRVNALIERVARWVLKRTGLVDRVKTGWRRRLSSSGPEHE